ncbi:unnamed protein product, partial [Brassica rapa]
CTHIHIKPCCTFFQFYLRSGILVNISSYFPNFLVFPATIIAATIGFFHLFSILLRFKCRLHFKIDALSLLNHFQL